VARCHPGGITQSVSLTVISSPLVWRLTKRLSGTIRLIVTYQDERGVLRQILSACERHGWQVTSVVTERATGMLATVDGVSSVQQLDDDTE
jgi:putative Mg2+ transporter-C (MgtC) family protein